MKHNVKNLLEMSRHAQMDPALSWSQYWQLGAWSGTAAVLTVHVQVLHKPTYGHHVQACPKNQPTIYGVDATYHDFHNVTCLPRCTTSSATYHDVCDVPCRLVLHHPEQRGFASLAPIIPFCHFWHSHWLKEVHVLNQDDCMRVATNCMHSNGKSSQLTSIAFLKWLNKDSLPASKESLQQQHLLSTPD